MSDGAWTCSDADCAYENEAADVECAACGEKTRPAAAGAGSSSGAEGGERAGYVCGLVLSAEAVAGKDKLLKLSVDIGSGEPIPVVTNAPNVKAGARVVIATVGATVGEIIVKKTSVGGVVSAGIVCDAGMLGWAGGGAGTAALLPESFAPGAPPPAKRPRLDGK